MKRLFDLIDNKVFALVILGIMLVIPILLLMLPINYFDGKESICLSQLIFKTKCYGCGMTKAIQHLIHFDIGNALKYNMLSIIVLPVLIYIWVKNFMV